MVETSQSGVEILRTLALAVRSEQDYGLTTDIEFSIGALKSGITEQEVTTLIRDYQPSYQQLDDFEILNLRQGLNKVAHADPTKSDFYLDKNEHDLILSGTYYSNNWVAIISLPKLCDAIETLPDVMIQG